MSKADALSAVLEEFASQLGPGSLIPSERVIADHYVMARTTVRQAIDRLLADGVLFRRHGHGTFVAVPRPGRIDMLTSFSQDMRARGMTPGGKVLSASTEQAAPALAARLQVAPGSPVLRLARLRTADDRPMALERINLSVERFPGLAELDWTDRSLYEELEREWGVRIGSTENRIAAVLPDPADAALLEIDASQPCLRVEGVTYDTNGVVLEAGRSWYRGDLYDAIVRVQHLSATGTHQY
jgi:GntR family transcriptional regulator